MFVDNMECYGYIYEGLKDKIPPGALHPDLFMFETDKDKWCKNIYIQIFTNV